MGIFRSTHITPKSPKTEGIQNKGMDKARQDRKRQKPSLNKHKVKEEEEE
jgi:hypothetical protein